MTERLAAIPAISVITLNVLSPGGGNSSLFVVTVSLDQVTLDISVSMPVLCGKPKPKRLFFT